MTNEQMEKKIQKLNIPLEHQIMMMCDDKNDMVLFAVAMLRKTISIFDQNYNPESRKALIEQYNKQDDIGVWKTIEYVLRWRKHPKDVKFFLRHFNYNNGSPIITYKVGSLLIQKQQIYVERK